MSVTTLLIVLLLLGGFGGWGWYGGWYGGPNPPAGTVTPGPGPGFWPANGLIQLLLALVVIVFLLRALGVAHF